VALNWTTQLLQMVEQPVRAVLLLFPISEASEAERREDDAKIAKDGQPKLDPTLFWIKQTVRPFFSMGII
jgi:ubiquitin carboxyl-terminal hydrolase L3